MRASFTGTVIVGLVTMAIKAFKTTQDHDLNFTLLHRKCKAPLKITHICKVCEQPVSTNDSINGIETSNGWILFEKQELEELEPVSADGHPIRGKQCIPLAQVNSLWYDQAYFMVPTDVQDMRPYALIKRVLRDERIAIVITYTTRGHAYLGLICANHDGLILRRLFYADNLRTIEDFQSGNAQIQLSAKEITLAKRLFKNMTRPFKHESYQDLRYLRLLEVLHAKEKKLPIPRLARQHPVPPRAAYLIDALNHSVVQYKQQTSK